MRVGLFGGRFDPPHMGHLLMAEQAREALPLDEVWFLPAGDPPHKPADAPPLDRLEMTRLAVQDHPAFHARADEVRRTGPSYAFHTVVDLQERHPEATFAYLIGADAWAEIETWHRAEALVRAVQMVVFPRRGTEAPPPPERFVRAATQIETVPFGVSGTLVRARVAAGRSLRYLVPDAVVAYLHARGLYARHDPSEAS